MSLNRRQLLAAGLALLPAGFAAKAQGAWPTRPLRLIVPFGPGSATDTIARVAAVFVAQAVGQNVVVDNRPGAGGSIALDALAQAPADGYTFAACSPSNMVINRHLTHLSYDPFADFAPLTQFVTLPSVLVVSPTVPARTLPELLAWLRANPGEAYASSGIGTTQHLTGQLLMMATGVQMTHVPHRGDASMLTDTISGRIPMLIQNVLAMLPQIRAGQLRAIAVFAPERVPQLPDVPTAAETIAGFDAPTWAGFVARAGTPEPILDRLSDALAAAARDPDIARRVIDSGGVPVGSTRAEFAAFLRREDARWEGAARASRVGVQ